MSVWRDNPDLMSRLARAQNHPANVHTDIVTYAGMADDRADLTRHVLHSEANVIRHEGVAAVAAALRLVKSARRALAA